LPPPPTSKGISQASQAASRAKQPTKLQRIQTTKKESVLVKEGKSLKQLELAHERASAVNDFKLPDGQQRLKIESRPVATRKFRPVDYDIHFTDLKDPMGTTSSGEFPDRLSDEELPASIALVDEPPRSNKRRSDKQNIEQSDSSQPPRKCPRQSLSTSVRTSGSSHTLKTSEGDSPQKDMSLSFQSDSSDDEGSIEISSPVPSTRRGENDQPYKPWLGTQTLLLDISDEADDLTVPNTNLEVPGATPEPMDHVMDEFAELQTWLESGAVEVV
jgi:hypothetical protein